MRSKINGFHTILLVERIGWMDGRKRHIGRHFFQGKYRFRFNKTLFYFIQGIGSAKTEEDKHLEFTTLKMAMQKNGDQGKKISYLKLDIEQSEVEVLRELIDSASDILPKYKIVSRGIF